MEIGEASYTPDTKMHDRPKQHPDGVFRDILGNPVAPDGAKNPEQAQHVMKLVDKYAKLVRRGEQEEALKPITSVDAALETLGLDGQQLTSDLIKSTYTKLMQYAHPDQYTNAGAEIHGGYDRDTIIGNFNAIAQKINEAYTLALNSLTSQG